LLALALVCKSLTNLVIPDHLDYRMIQCGPRDTQLWQHLIDYPHLAFTPLIIPGKWSDDGLGNAFIISRRSRSNIRTQIEYSADGDFRYAGILLGVIATMSNLRYFEWTMPMRLRGEQEPFPPLVYIFHSIAKSCPRIQYSYLLRDQNTSSFYIGSVFNPVSSISHQYI
ncbi:hypothetical protein M422DRAFT_155913, partial [Sphaerobolus stellatus SS14]